VPHSGVQQNLRVEPSKSVQPPPPGFVGGNKRKYEGNSSSPSTSGTRTGSLLMKDDRSQREFQALVPSGSDQTLYGSSPRGLKLINRIGGDVSMGEPTLSLPEGPALLRRLSPSDTHASNGTFRPSQLKLAHPTLPMAAPPAMPMLSIKGAASKHVPKEEPPQPPTLIDRLQVGEFSHDGQGNWKKKRRQKVAGG
jgi:hypothetical protein